MDKRRFPAKVTYTWPLNKKYYNCVDPRLQGFFSRNCVHDAGLAKYMDTELRIWRECETHQLFATPRTIRSWNSPSQNTGVGILSLLQGIFPTQKSNGRLLHYKWILYQLKAHEFEGLLWSYTLISDFSVVRDPNTLVTQGQLCVNTSRHMWTLHYLLIN